MFIFNKKLQLIKAKFKVCHVEVFGDVHKQVTITSNHLAQIRNLIQKKGAFEYHLLQEKKI